MKIFSSSSERDSTYFAVFVIFLLDTLFQLSSLVFPINILVFVMLALYKPGLHFLARMAQNLSPIKVESIPNTEAYFLIFFNICIVLLLSRIISPLIIPSVLISLTQIFLDQASEKKEFFPELASKTLENLSLSGMLVFFFANILFFQAFSLLLVFRIFYQVYHDGFRQPVEILDSKLPPNQSTSLSALSLESVYNFVSSLPVKACGIFPKMT